MRTLNKESLRLLLVGLFSLLACTRMFGYFISPELSKLGRTLAFAPAPAPFVTLRSYGSYGEEGAIIFCTDASGREEALPFDRELKQKMGYSDWRVAYYSSLLYLSLEKSESSQNLFRHLLKKSFCEEKGPLLSFSSCGKPVSKIRYEYRHIRGAKTPRSVSVEFSCHS